MWDLHRMGLDANLRHRKLSSAQALAASNLQLSEDNAQLADNLHMLLDHVQHPWDCRLQSFVGAAPFGDPRAPGDPPSADARVLLAHDVWPEECLLQTFVGHTPRTPKVRLRLGLLGSWHKA